MANDGYENIALKFDTKVQTLKNKLNKISKNLHIDVSKYLKQIKDIENEYKLNDSNSIFASGNIAVKLTIEGMFMDGLSSLSSIEKVVDNFEVYYSAYMCALDMEKMLNMKISNKKLDEYVSTCKKLIKFKSLPIEDYKTVSFIIDKIYEVSYKTMKYELLINGDSKLYNYIKDYDNDVDRISNLLDKDLKLGQNIILSNDKYLKELLTMVAIKENPDYLDYLLSRIKDVGIEYSEKKLSYDLGKQELNEKYGRSKLEIKSRLISLIISSSIMLGALALVKVSDKEKYQTKVSTSYKACYEMYDSYKGIKTQKEEYIDIKDKTDKVKLTIYHESDNDNNRKIETYELPSLDIEPQEYLYKIHSYNNNNLVSSEVVSNSGFESDEYYYIVEMPPIIDERDIVETTEQVLLDYSVFNFLSRLFFVFGCVLVAVDIYDLFIIDGKTLIQVKRNMSKIMKELNSNVYNGISKEEIDLLNQKYNDLDNRYKELIENNREEKVLRRKRNKGVDI